MKSETQLSRYWQLHLKTKSDDHKFVSIQGSQTVAKLHNLVYDQGCFTL